MACERFETLNRFHDGDLPPAEAVEFRKHLHVCPECRTELHQIEQSERLVRDVVQNVLPSGLLSEKVLRRIKQENLKIEVAEPSPANADWSHSWVVFLKWLGPVLAILLLVVVIRGRSPRPLLPEEQRPIVLTAQALSDRENIGPDALLPGNPRVLPADLPLNVREKMLLTWLDGGQQVEISGSARVQVNPRRLNWQSGNAEIRFTLQEPFLVTIGKAELTITGTRIYFKGSATGSVDVTLLEGKLRYRTARATGEFIPGTPLVFRDNECYPELSSSGSPALQPMIDPAQTVSPQTPESGPPRISPFEGAPVQAPRGVQEP